MTQAESQGKLWQVLHFIIEKLFEFFHTLADLLLPVSSEVVMAPISLRKRRLRRNASGDASFIKRNSDDDTNFLLPTKREEVLFR